MASSQQDSGVIIIKKYANRRLYNTESSSYITLEHLAEMVRKKREFKVIDAKSGNDITHTVLTQIIMEEEARGTTMLPINFLRQLIGMYGDSMQAMVPHYLEESMEAFQRNQAQFRDVLTEVFTAGPFAEMAKRNMEVFSAAAKGAQAPKAEPVAPEKGKDGEKAELAELKAQLAALQEKLAKLSN